MLPLHTGLVLPGLFDVLKLSNSDSSVSPGSVIRDSRLIYDHYGIYSGKGNVIHFTDGIIQETNLRFFTKNQIIDAMGFSDDAIRGISLAQSLGRAKSKVGQTGYDLIDNNCEHFAIWCRTGKAISTQAFGSKSKNYTGSLTGIITALCKKEAGMGLSRRILVSKISDRR